MTTTTSTTPSTSRTSTRPRVWLVAGQLDTNPHEPADHPAVRDDLMRVWEPDPAGGYRTRDGRHHTTWPDLHNRHDLMEVSPR